jgi:DNA invertase Pin-like site-specific DNA recombinase
MTNNKYQDKYLIYARKSTDDADNQKNSIDYQVGQCLSFAEKYGLEIADCDIEDFCEKGVIKEKHSAYKTSKMKFNKDGKMEFQIERPKFQSLVEKLFKREFKGLICLCWDRLSRNDQDSMVIKNLANHESDIIFVQVTYDNTSAGDLHRDIDGMFAQHHSRTISEKVKSATKKLREEGKCIYMSPIGYIDNGSDDKKIDEERAPLVKRVFELYSTGEWSLAELAKWANKQGLTTKPTRRRRTKKEILAGVDQKEIPKIAKPVNNKTIENILKNPFYIGKIKINKRDNTQFLDGNHSPLIDINIYNKAQEVLKRKNVSIKYVEKDFFVYRGILKCECGRSYSPYIKKGHVYYRSRCKSGCCNNIINISEKKVNSLVEEMLGKISFSEQELEEIRARMEKDIDKISEKRSKELDDLHTQRKRVLGDID